MTLTSWFYEEKYQEIIYLLFFPMHLYIPVLGLLPIHPMLISIAYSPHRMPIN